MKYLDIKYTLSVGQILSAEFKTLIYVLAHGHVTVVYCYNLVYLQTIKNYYYKITEQQFLAIYHVITLAQKKIKNHSTYVPCD